MIAQAELARFLAQLDDHRVRLAALAEGSSGELGAEARTAGEELLTAKEELRVLQEELDATRSVAGLTGAAYDAEFGDASTAYLRTDTEGLILEANAAARDLLSWPLMRWSRRPFASHFTLPTRGTVRSLITRAARRTGHVTGEAVLRCADDREMRVRLAVAASPYAGTLRWVVIPAGSAH